VGEETEFLRIEPATESSNTIDEFIFCDDEKLGF
jgi:hypothetical protein